MQSWKLWPGLDSLHSWKLGGKTKTIFHASVFSFLTVFLGSESSPAKTVVSITLKTTKQETGTNTQPLSCHRELLSFDITLCTRNTTVCFCFVLCGAVFYRCTITLRKYYYKNKYISLFIHRKGNEPGHSEHTHKSLSGTLYVCSWACMNVWLMVSKS